MEMPHVMGGELYPVYVEEYLNIIVGLVAGMLNYLLLDQNNCKAAVLETALAVTGLHVDFDKEYSTMVAPIIFRVLFYSQVLFKIYGATMKCIEERTYFETLEMWQEADFDEAETMDEPVEEAEEELVEDDFFILRSDIKLRDDAPWEPVNHPEYDEAWMEAGFGDYTFLVFQFIKVGLMGYKVYTSILSSYYWFSFGNSIVHCVTAIYNIIVIFLDWEKFIYDRHMLGMLIWRMNDDLGIEQEGPTRDGQHLGE